MIELYVPNGAMVVCTEGKKNTSIRVISQTSVRINGKLQATENDRFRGNFQCPKMVSGSSALSGMVGVAVGALGGPVGALVGYFAGKFIGGLLGNGSTRLLPGLCSSLCASSRWEGVHPNVRICGQHALMEKSQLRCPMGGNIHIVMPNIKVALTHARLAQGVYTNVDYDISENNSEIDGFAPVSAERAEEILKDDWRKFLDQDKKNGFYATLYEDQEGNVVVSYRGTDLGAGIQDVKEDVAQAMGISSDQYDAAVALAQKVQKAKKKGTITGDVSITGHSLGGGLATLAGSATGYPTYTYNAAAVHESTYERNGISKNIEHVQAYVGSKDPLNAFQDNREAVLSGAVLIAPALPVMGVGCGTAVAGVPGAVLGGTLGAVSSEVLFFAGIWGTLTGGMPRQQGVQRIEVPQNSSWSEGHMIGDLIQGLEQMQKRMGTRNPVYSSRKMSSVKSADIEKPKKWWEAI
jgi:hypothetical protein